MNSYSMIYQLTPTSDLLINTQLTKIYRSLEYLHQDHTLLMTLKQNSTTLIYHTPKILCFKRNSFELVTFH